MILICHGVENADPIAMEINAIPCGVVFDCGFVVTVARTVALMHT